MFIGIEIRFKWKILIVISDQLPDSLALHLCLNLQRETKNFWVYFKCEYYTFM